MSIERCEHDVAPARRPQAAGARPRPLPCARSPPRRLAGIGLRCRARHELSERSWRMSTSRQPSAEVTPGLGGTMHGRDRQLLGERGAVQRPGAAERDEREVARVVAAADRDQPHGVGHVGVGDLDDRVGRLVQLEAEAARRRRLSTAWAASAASSVISPPTRLVPRRPSTRLASVLVGCSLPLP